MASTSPIGCRPASDLCSRNDAEATAEADRLHPPTCPEVGIDRLSTAASLVSYSLTSHVLFQTKKNNQINQFIVTFQT